MAETAAIKVATFNIRSLRSLDRASWWWRRRHRLRTEMMAIGADIWGLQEVYRGQNRWLDANVFGIEWKHHGQGRNRHGGGEMCPIWVNTSAQRVVATSTRWYSDTPEKPGSKLPGARFPRLVSFVEICPDTDSLPFVVANTHLDERSATRRRASLELLTRWLQADYAENPAIVLGDINCTLNDSLIEPLLDLGLRPVLKPDDGPTAHDFGKNPQPSQIDHIFISPHWRVHSVNIVREAGHASDHWPVTAELSR